MMKEKQNALRVRPVVGNTHTHTFERNRAETRNFTNREGAKTGQIKIKNEEGGERGGGGTHRCWSGSSLRPAGEGSGSRTSWRVSESEAQTHTEVVEPGTETESVCLSECRR